MFVFALKAMEELSKDIEDIDEAVVDAIIADLAEITDTNTTGGTTNFATDLETTNSIVESTLTYLTQTHDLTRFNEVLSASNSAPLCSRCYIAQDTLYFNFFNLSYTRYSVF